jgi:putative methyltransferase (TIGR04325 family)|tara:strand:- start:16132 stop:16875 length:744 start_codon:yes stop_codon:yes gene_type:complete
MNIWKKIKPKDIKNTFNNPNDSFNSNIWISKIKKKVSQNILLFKTKKFFEYYISSSPIPWILLNEKKRNIRILDFGSGFQEVFFQLINSKNMNNIIIDSIEKENVCRELRKDNFFKKKNVKINFFEKINFKKKYDYVHISDSLQYMVEWKKILKKISEKKPKFIILNNLTGGDFETYYTEQNFYNNKLIYIFFNLDEIKKILKNYEIVHKSLFLNKIKNEYVEYPQKNFKNKDKLGFPKTVVFKFKG